MKYTLSDILKKFRSAHGGTYCYNKVRYINKRTKVIITCHEHGDFLQLVYKHFNGDGCPECGKQRRIAKTTKGLDAFLKEANLVHGNFYSYVNSVYVNARTPISIACPIHGAFSQLPTKHLIGAGCKKCATEETADTNRVSQKSFLSECSKTHGRKYSYAKSVYTGDHAKIVITCREHGDFVQCAGRHKRGSGCPSCQYSGFKPHDKAVFYVIETNSFIGYGITNNFDQRLKQHEKNLHNRNVEILNIYEFQFSVGLDAIALERKVKRKVKSHTRIEIPGFKTEALKSKFLDKLLSLVEKQHAKCLVS